MTKQLWRKAISSIAFITNKSTRCLLLNKQKKKNITFMIYFYRRVSVLKLMFFEYVFVEVPLEKEFKFKKFNSNTQKYIMISYEL